MFYTIDSIAPVCRKLQNANCKLVLATGFFDLLHVEHINFLQKAKEIGDVLIAAVESDGRARKLKGEGRPIESQVMRCQKVAKYADYVIALGDDFDNVDAYESLMSSIRPSIYAVSSHTAYLELKQQLTKKYGGVLVVVHDWNPQVSTTKILNTKNHV
jgi:cytidyltransferase-related domain